MFVTSCPTAFASSVSSGARCRCPRLVGSNGACISGGSHARARAAGDTAARYSRTSKPSIRAPQDTPSTADTDTTAAIPTASTHTCSTDGYPPHASSSSVSSYTAAAVTLGHATVIVSSVVCSSSSSSSLSSPAYPVACRSRYWDMCARIPSRTCSMPSSSLESASSQMPAMNEDSGLTNSSSSSSSFAPSTSSSLTLDFPCLNAYATRVHAASTSGDALTHAGDSVRLAAIASGASNDAAASSDRQLHLAAATQFRPSSPSPPTARRHFGSPRTSSATSTSSPSMDTTFSRVAATPPSTASSLKSSVWNRARIDGAGVDVEPVLARCDRASMRTVTSTACASSPFSTFSSALEMSRTPSSTIFARGFEAPFGDPCSFASRVASAPLAPRVR